jgi:hypothetical protein
MPLQPCPRGRCADRLRRVRLDQRLDLGLGESDAASELDVVDLSRLGSSPYPVRPDAEHLRDIDAAVQAQRRAGAGLPHQRALLCGRRRPGCPWCRCDGGSPSGPQRAIHILSRCAWYSPIPQVSRRCHVTRVTAQTAGGPDRRGAESAATALADAGEVVLKVIGRRCKILGFEKPTDMTEAPRTIVIGGTSEQYVAGLKAIIAEGDVDRP